jgi:hypothetical protein
MARLDPTGPVVLRAPATATVQVHADLAYAHRDQRTLLLDVYAPADQTPASGWPAVLLVHGTTEPTLLRGARGWGQYTAAGCARWQRRMTPTSHDGSSGTRSASFSSGCTRRCDLAA